MSLRASFERPVVTSPTRSAALEHAPAAAAPTSAEVRPRPGYSRDDAFITKDFKSSVGKVADVSVEAVHDAKAQALNAKGQQALKEGRYDDAKRAFEELKTLPKRDMQLLGSDCSANADGTHDHPAKGTGVNKTVIDDRSFHMSNVDVAEAGLKQAAQLEKMSKLSGKTPFDPHNLTHVKAYFQAFSKGKSTDDVRKEFGEYLTNFYKHPGEKGTLDWSPSVAVKDRPGKLDTLLAAQPTDKAGRKIVDCEGFAYLTAAVLGDVKSANGKPRFDVYMVGGNAAKKDGEKADPNALGSGHEIAMVFDNDSKPSGRRFNVNNNETELYPVPIPTLAGRDAIAGASHWEYVKHQPKP
ncbi:MAG: hypothetical protein GQE15_29130 [Archangiaceae bacterium]|nr:hypothetical protein [Archangiaceae bacterium]